MISKGAWYVGLAYTLWGFFPLYWKVLGAIPALQLICHRIVWSVAILAIMVARSREWHVLGDAVGSPRVIAIYAVAAVTIALNWLMFVWAVSIDQVVQISLGYFVNPLLSVVLGTIVFRERLRRLQWISVAVAATGVLYLTVAAGAFPWIGLFLASSFAIYGLMKKMAPLGPVPGLALETGILLFPAAAFLSYEEMTGNGAFMRSGALRDTLMVASGPVTTLPLLLFAAGVPRIPLSLVGMLQYVNPTMQLFIGVLVFGEPFSRAHVVGFGLVWGALALFAIEGVASRRWPQLGVTDVS